MIKVGIFMADGCEEMKEIQELNMLEEQSLRLKQYQSRKKPR